ncbi:class I SAM-dependent methyltransferase [Komagataeibacter sp. AV436]|uniref:Class I SAM-dependent methyltransferase n=1 Tax=Komagataeibacter melomenusus TaxID=2766578 RepID=A0ABX2AGV5_9PROT|nr:class I SAM-dependent methyltransferase [Komagataeibacter melomenusus]MBV1831303.1 class I SAM-dependent methyltransferase [Komagataeibacter melomenusus]NPC67044.1 class I SAM-dependent methyltransferase [Komagataeibacter melomenusus]
MTTLDRSRPRIWDTDWLLLRQLVHVIRKETSSAFRPGQTLLDLGCVDMPYREIIENEGIRYLGADIDGRADIRISQDGKVDVPDHSIDAVLSVQVLEHVRDLDSYCCEIHRLLRPDGTLFLSTHGTWLYHPHPEDHRRWTRTGLIHDLETRGLHGKEMRGFVGPLATTTMLRLTGYAYVLRKLPVVGRFLARIIAVIMNLRGLMEDCITSAQMCMDNACVYWVKARPV